MKGFTNDYSIIFNLGNVEMDIEEWQFLKEDT